MEAKSAAVPDGTASAAPKKASRVRMAIVMGLVLIAVAMLGGWFWALTVLAVVYIGFNELKAIMDGVHFKPSAIIVYSSAVLMIYFATHDKPQFLSPIITLAVIASFFRLLFRQPRATIGDIGATLLAVFYVVYLPMHYILLRNLGAESTATLWEQPGFHYVMMTVVVIAFSDIGAYYVGKKMGKNLLYPAISPKKTREGAIGGLLCGVFGGLAAAYMWNFPPLHMLVLSVILVVVGQLGDLTESMMKRDSGVKDSGLMLAGHGGLLDRIDSYIFSGVVSYYYIYWIVLDQGIAPEFRNWLMRGLGL